MKHINDYSDLEIKRLYKRFQKIKIYRERVEFVYKYFGTIQGRIQKDGTDIFFPIKPIDEQENRIRWEYYFEMKTNETFHKLKSDYEARYKKAPNSIRFINDELVNIANIYNQNRDYKYGYEMGSLAKNFDFVNWEAVHDIYRIEFLNPYYIGLAYYHLEEWLLGLKEKIKLEEIVDSEDLSLPDEMKVPHRIALMSELGIFDSLISRYPSQLENRKSRIIGLLSIICGYRKGSNEYQNFEAKMKKILNGDPHTEATIREVKSVLAKFNIDLMQKGRVT
jgi:hypothetical protein